MTTVRARLYTTVDVEEDVDVSLGDIEDDELIGELRARGYRVLPAWYGAIPNPRELLVMFDTGRDAQAKHILTDIILHECSGKAPEGGRQP